MPFVFRKFRRAALLGLLVLASGCASPPRVDDYSASWPDEPPPANQSNGAIYQAGYDVPLFENAVAHRVGDTLTIRLVERTNASKSSTTNTSKSSKVEFPLPNVAGSPIDPLQVDIDNESQFSGKGDSAQSNRLEGDITVTVAKRLANGNLLVRGQKWITINQGSEFVRIQGIVRPVDIEPSNTILSTKVADAVISYGAKGSLADANRPGLLSRFFSLPWLPF
jgi:flagellar L-ring protein precursor FlgH